MQRKFKIVAALLLGGILLGQESPRTIWDGVFTEGQALRGQTLYSSQCASCHGANLDGRGPTPPLAGKEFANNWNGMTMKDLFDKVQTSMPADKVGSLTPQQNADILAYLLRANQAPAGQAELPIDPETLDKIRFDAAKKN